MGRWVSVRRQTSGGCSDAAAHACQYPGHQLPAGYFDPRFPCGCDQTV